MSDVANKPSLDELYPDLKSYEYLWKALKLETFYDSFSQPIGDILQQIKSGVIKPEELKDRLGDLNTACWEQKCANERVAAVKSAIDDIIRNQDTVEQIQLFSALKAHLASLIIVDERSLPDTLMCQANFVRLR